MSNSHFPKELTHSRPPADQIPWRAQFRQLVAALYQIAQEADRCLAEAESDTQFDRHLEYRNAAHLSIGPLYINLVAHILLCHGVRINLALREWEVLGYLIFRLGRAVPREELWREVWQWHAPDLDTHAEQVCIQNLRRKLAKAGADGLLWRLPKHQYVLFFEPVASKDDAMRLALGYTRPSSRRRARQTVQATII